MTINTPNKKKLSFIIIVLTILFICASIVSIFILNYQFDKNLTSKSEQASDISALRIDIEKVVTKSSPSTILDRINKQLDILEEDKFTEQEKYDALTNVYAFLLSEYSRSSDNNYQELINIKLENYAKENFIKLHKDGNKFYAPCLDPTCQELPHPKELTSILGEIKNSDLPDEVKQSLTEDLTSFGYLSASETESKARAYFMLGFMLERGNTLSNNGSNAKISSMIYELVKNNYPEEYVKLNTEKAEIIQTLNEFNEK